MTRAQRSVALKLFGNPEAILSRDSVGRRVAITATVQSDDMGRFYLGFVEGRAE